MLLFSFFVAVALELEMERALRVVQSAVRGRGVRRVHGAGVSSELRGAQLPRLGWLTRNPG